VIDLPVVISMLTAIHLHDQAPLETDEIEIEPQKRGLSSEVEPVSAHHPKLQPQARFLWGQGLSQLASVLRCSSGLPHPGRFAACPSP
jgi:hypothetical protein